MEEKDNGGPGKRTEAVANISDCVGGNGADEEVSNEPTTKGSGESNDHETKGVKVAADSGHRSFQAEDESSRKINREEKFVGRGFHRTAFIVSDAQQSTYDPFLTRISPGTMLSVTTDFLTPFSKTIWSLSSRNSQPRTKTVPALA